MSNAEVLVNAGRVITRPIFATGILAALDRLLLNGRTGRRCYRQSARRSLFMATTGFCKRAPGLRVRLHSALMIGDPRLGIGFGGELADDSGIGLRDLHFDAERPA